MAKALQQNENLMMYVKKINIAFTSKYIIFSADIQSKSRKNLVHYTRVLLDIETKKIIKESCDCEGYTFKKKCWHTSLLKSIIHV